MTVFVVVVVVVVALVSVGARAADKKVKCGRLTFDPEETTRDVWDWIPIRNDCEECLNNHPLNNLTYVALAKAGTRTVRDYLCWGWKGDDYFLKPIDCSRKGGVHHCHRCTVSDLEKRGATTIVVPLRDPADRFASLIQSSVENMLATEEESILSCWAEDGIENATNRIVDAMRDFADPKHGAVMAARVAIQVGMLGLSYYLNGTAGTAALRFVCIDRVIDMLHKIQPPLDDATFTPYHTIKTIDHRPLTRINRDYLYAHMDLDLRMYNALCSEKKQ